ncbi:MAG: sterol desaturase family protein [Elusimicrobiota bacterium]|mgnify:CR=1 FL=1
MNLAISAPLTVLAAFAVSEFLGYWLHRLLHSEKIAFLSRNHMIHHLVVYAPDKPMRPDRKYLKATYGRASLDGIGLEWLIPAGIILTTFFTAFTILGTGILHRAIFVVSSFAWAWMMFHYMHDAMHLKDFWMERSSPLSRWFLGARRLHDIHHMDLADSGRMETNFGICFFLFDRLFGTIEKRHNAFNQTGLRASRRRYAFIFE